MIIRKIGQYKKTNLSRSLGTGMLVFAAFFLAISCSGRQTGKAGSGGGDEIQKPTPVLITEVIVPAETATPAPTATLSPIEITATAQALQHEENMRIFDQFISDLKTGEPDIIVGVWIENVLALRVLYQPPGNPGFVSTEDEIVTYFMMVWQKSGNHGLLAHNYLAGRYFFNIQVGDIITIVFGDGNYEDFEVISIKEYQALQPDSPYSNFIDLESGEQLTSTNLFMDIYMGDYHTTLQTCIANGAETEWGRMFTLAPPLY